MINNLWIIVPVYNEELCIETVVNEWTNELIKHNLNYTFCILNDGSKDNTLKVLYQIKNKYSNIEIIDKPNTGHGQTCVYGYKLALERGADWIFQIDSDGQCNPIFFSKFLALVSNKKCIFGVRSKREDGASRMIISFFVTMFVFVSTFRFLRDPNVPYRLIHSSVMNKIVHKIPSDFYLANILVSILANEEAKIKWVKIIFRNRIGGVPSIKNFTFVKHGKTLFKQLQKFKNY